MKKYCQTLTLVDNEEMITKTMILETFGTSDQRSRGQDWPSKNIRDRRLKTEEIQNPLRNLDYSE